MILWLKWLILLANLFSNLSTTKMPTLPTLWITGKLEFIEEKVIDKATSLIWSSSVISMAIMMGFSWKKCPIHNPSPKQEEKKCRLHSEETKHWWIEEIGVPPLHERFFLNFIGFFPGTLVKYISGTPMCWILDPPLLTVVKVIDNASTNQHIFPFSKTTSTFIRCNRTLQTASSPWWWWRHIWGRSRQPITDDNRRRAQPITTPHL